MIQSLQSEAAIQGIKLGMTQRCNLVDGNIDCPNFDGFTNESEYALSVYNPRVEEAFHFTFKMNQSLLRLKVMVASDGRIGWQESRTESFCPMEDEDRCVFYLL